jgi:hypothetical protein
MVRGSADQAMPWWMRSVYPPYGDRHDGFCRVDKQSPPQKLVDALRLSTLRETDVGRWMLLRKRFSYRPGAYTGFPRFRRW